VCAEEFEGGKAGKYWLLHFSTSLGTEQMDSELQQKEIYRKQVETNERKRVLRRHQESGVL
jgi:hypothetical protein